MLDPGGPTALHQQCAFLAIVLQCALLMSKVLSLSADGAALMMFRDAVTGDPQNALKDWTASDDSPCAWSGITCAPLTSLGNTSGKVVGVELIGKTLSGTISSSLGALSSLQYLKLQGNSFNGSLPVELFNATSLQTLLLGGNRITGALPPQIGKLINLRVLDISSNQLIGPIPASLTKCTSLQSLVLARNLLSGSLPLGFGMSLTSLEQLDLSTNSLSGSIPEDFGKLSALQGTLNLSFNKLSGSIPLSLGSLPYTVSLDLSHNNLSGRIPQDGSLAEQGPGPFLYNPGLCGFPLTIVCPVTPFLSPLPSLPSEASTPLTPMTRLNSSAVLPRPRLSAGSIVAIVVGDAAAVSLIACLIVYVYWKTKDCRKRDFFTGCSRKDIRMHAAKIRCFQTQSAQESEGSPAISDKEREQGELIALDKDFSFDIDELLRASAYVLGKSGLGIVYKVIMGNGMPIVVRRIGEGSSQKRKDFEAEVHAIGKLRHPNLVRMLAYYWANDEKLLIYEFISHGSLASALHWPHPQKSSRALTWEERLRIARGVARGLAYLHECSPRKYIHGEITTTKILLDGGMHPFIADFGLSRLAMFANVDDVAGNQMPMSQAYGAAPDWSGPQTGTSTMWIKSMYRAPEARAQPATTRPTQKWDVYGYGVVVMELICGRVRALQMAAGGVDVVEWMRRAATAAEAGEDEGGLEGVVDPAIRGAARMEAMAALLNLAVACTNPSPEQRPKMRAVADSLDKLVLCTAS
ncbi:hypothetical protein KP509_30G012600 [Ceratopteris richardii]|uniref:Protein kinase domain-containing protein n=1 Tax=Ceratopteris richardii TaxID=49495 RepID=A0A8T2R255_CERRI|nr:hypothetical protein KP509_30G012600 [Ceratopteris richardii]